LDERNKEKSVTDTYLKINADEIRALEEEYLFPTYKRYNLCVSHGSGAYLYDLDGRRYLDFLAGIAVNSLGYNHPRLVQVLLEQGQRVIHCSNLFYHPYQGQLAKRLAGISGMAKVFFTNSGTEAMEAALKIARAYPRTQARENKVLILALKNSFHGRTFGALSITAQEKYQAPFRPLIPEVGIVEDFTVRALEQAFNDRVCALVLEPIQGEAGVVPLPEDFLRAARRLCDRFDALLILDEIQCGLGRTGKYFAFQHYGIQPDLMTLAKSLAAGYPLGAVLGNARVAQSLKPGDHGTTFGGGPLACRLALEVLDVIEQEDLLAKVSAHGTYLLDGLRRISRDHSSVGEIRGLGLMIGVEIGPLAKSVVQKLLEGGVIANAAHETVLRLLPPFVITREEIDHFLGAFEDALTAAEAEAKASSANAKGA
jgi:acetylornithine aminotransferase/acetylornithine/N-succinyldiaminopimelate aminotransferase